PAASRSAPGTAGNLPATATSPTSPSPSACATRCPTPRCATPRSGARCWPTPSCPTCSASSSSRARSISSPDCSGNPAGPVTLAPTRAACEDQSIGRPDEVTESGGPSACGAAEGSEYAACRREPDYRGPPPAGGRGQLPGE